MRKNRRLLAGWAAAVCVSGACAQVFGIDPPNEVAQTDASLDHGSEIGIDGTVDAVDGGVDAMDATKPPDASPDASPDVLDDAPVDSGPIPTIQGTRVVLYVPDNGNGVTAVPVDFTTTPITATMLLPDGGVQTYDGGGKGDGTFTIDGVPLGAEYFVSLQTAGPATFIPTVTYFYSTARSLDLSTFAEGRSNLAFVDAATSITLNVSNALPTTQFDQFELEALNAHFVHFQVQKFGSTFEAGVTSFTSSVTVFAGSGVVTAPSDKTWLIQAYADPADTVVQAKVLRSYYATTAFSVVNGATVTLDASMIPIAPTSGHVVTWDRDSFSSLINQIAPNGSTGLYLLGIDALPTAGDAGVSSDEIRLADLWAVQRNAPGVEPLEAGFGDPFPAFWTRVATVQMAVTPTPFTIPVEGGTSNPGTATATLACQFPFPAIEGQTLQPLVGPPLTVLIDGHPATANQAVSARPTVSWTAPSIGTPTGYFIDVLDVAADSSNNLALSTVARIYTGATSVAFPPGLLQSQHTYIFEVVAVSSAGDSPAAPAYVHLPYCMAPTLSGLLTR